MDCFTDVLGTGHLRFHQKYLNLCSKDERRSYGFGMTWGWVINDRIFIFGWTNTLSWYLFLQYAICSLPWHPLRPVHTKNVNYKDSYISIHISGQYRLFILCAHSSATLNSQACYSRIYFVWVLMYLSFISCKKKIILKVIPAISFLWAFIVCCGVDQNYLSLLFSL